MSKKVIRTCDRCGIEDSKDNPVAGYRWMILPGYESYKGLNKVAVDLCKDCNNIIVAMLKVNLHLA